MKDITKMTREERVEYFLELNKHGYEGDTFIHEEIKTLVEKFGINLIVETGTYHGYTTKRLSEFAPVVSFEINKTNYEIAKNNLQSEINLPYKIALFNEDSVKGLKEGFGLYMEEKRLYFLDAHWNEHCPLIDELELIAKDEKKPVIVIHDFKVPNKDFGFDSYKGQDFDFEWIKPSLEKIYGKNPEAGQFSKVKYSYHYNKEANGAYRGVIYIYPNVL